MVTKLFHVLSSCELWTGCVGQPHEAREEYRAGRLEKNSKYHQTSGKSPIFPSDTPHMDSEWPEAWAQVPDSGTDRETQRLIVRLGGGRRRSSRGKEDSGEIPFLFLFSSVLLHSVLRHSCGLGNDNNHSRDPQAPT